MLVIGERINGMFDDVKAAIKERNAKVIQDLAKRQVESGASVLDVNVGPSSDDPQGVMKWLIEVIQEVTPAALAIDSPNIKVVKGAFEVCKNEAIINSTTGQKEKMEALIPLAVEKKASIIGLTMDEKGIPRDADLRAEIAVRIVTYAGECGLPIENLYIDPIILPCNVAQPQAGHVLETIKQVKILSDPAPKTVIGLSNVSQGTKDRELINRIYAVMAITAGLDAAIMDPMDDDLMNAVITAELLLNKNIYCDSFLKAYRK